MLRKAFLASLLLVGCLTTVASAQVSIVAGDHLLQPGTAGQQIMIMTSGQAAFQGTDLYLEIGGGVAGPMITAIDIIGPGTLFFGNNFGQSDFGDPLPARSAVALASTQSGSVGPNGVLAIVTLDTTGVPFGTYALSLTSQLYGPSDLPPWNIFDENMSLVDGTLTIVPEPASVVLGLFAFAGVGAVAIRRRRARKA